MIEFNRDELNSYFEEKHNIDASEISKFASRSLFGNSAFFISRYIKGSDREQRVFSDNCEEILNYSKEELESTKVYNDITGVTLMDEIINDFSYDQYIEELKSFEGIDIPQFVKVDDLYDRGEFYKAIVNIAPVYQDENVTFWITYISDVRNLNFDNSELNRTLTNVGVVLVKTVIKNGRLTSVDDHCISEFFNLDEKIDDPLSFIESHLTDPNSQNYQKDYNSIIESATSGNDNFESKFEWIIKGERQYFSILSVVTARLKQEISVVSVINNETDIFKLKEKLRQKNDELEFALDLTKSNILSIKKEEPEYFFVDISVIQQFGIIEEDYDYLGKGTYRINWHQKMRDYFNISFSDLFDIRKNMKKLIEGKIEDFDIILRKDDDYEGVFTSSYFLLVFSKLKENTYIGVITDITDRHENEIQLYKTQKMFEAASSAGSIGVWYIDLNEDPEHIFCTDTLANMYDFELSANRKYRREDWYAKVKAYCPEDIYIDMNDKAQKALKGITNSYDVIYPFRKQDGSIRWYQEKSSNIERDEFGNAIVLPGVTLDVTDSVMREEAAKLEGITCSLTGLKNRIAFERGYEQNHYENKIIYFMDLDDFGNVNTNFSHQYGDQFLRETGRKLSELEDDIDVYRIGGDEFMIIIDKYDSHFVEKVFNAVKQTVYIDDIGLAVTSSIGVIDLKKHQADSFDDLLSLLSMTMTEAKKLGKNYYVEVAERHLTQFARNKVLYSEFSKGLKEETVVPFFQPYVDARADRVIGFEALARIVIDGVMYYPNEFIPMLEIGDNIAKLDIMMFEHCCRLAEKLENMHVIEGQPIYSSNLSTRSIRYLRPDDFIAVSNKYQVKRDRLEIEVTEQVLINETGYSMIDDLSGLGYKIAVDDFSAGYASLKYVSQMTADTLKIDRALLNDLELKEGSRNVIYKAVIDLAKELNLNIVSEGIESEAQAKVVKRLEGEIYQGFYCSKPIPTHEFINYIKEYNDIKE